MKDEVDQTEKVDQTERLLQVGLNIALEPPVELNRKVKGMIMQNDNNKNRRRIWTNRIVITTAAALMVFCVGVNTSLVFAKTVQKIPIIGRIAQTITFVTYKEKEEEKQVYIEVPKIDSNSLGGNYESVQVLNQNIAEYTDQLINDYHTTNASVFAGYDVVTDNDSYFTIKVWTSMQGEEKQEFTHYFTIDKTKDEVVTLTSLFNKGYDYNTVIQEKVRLEMERIMSEGKEITYNLESSYLSIIIEEGDFYITENNELILVFAAESIAPDVMGIQEIKVGILKDGELVEDTSVEDNSYKTVEGIIEDATMQSIIIKTDSGELLSFTTEGVEKDTHGLGILIGDKAIITYEGGDNSMKETLSEQVEKVIKIETFR